MLNVNDIGLDSNCLDADLQVEETLKLQKLTISDSSLTPNPCGSVLAKVEAKHCFQSEDPCLEEVVEKPLKTTETMSEDWDENSTVSVSKYSDESDEDDFPFPVLYRNRDNEDDPLMLFEIPKKKEDYDSDDTCDEYVECGEKGLCKCKRMRGREYYQYYAETKDEEDYYTLYPQAKRTLPKGNILHFTGAPPNMERKHITNALTALGAKIEFTDYQRGSEEGWIRLSFAHEARIIIKKMNNKQLNILGADLSFTVLSGKHEKRYHKKVITDMYKLQEKAKGLNKKLKKRGYTYVVQYYYDYS